MQRLTLIYKGKYGVVPEWVEALPGAGSNRRYYRLHGRPGGETVIGVVGTSCDENRAFIYLSGHFAMHRLPVPEVLAVSDDGLCYLQTDLGCRSLFDALRTGREAGGYYSEEEKDLLRRTITELPALQIRGARGLDFTECYPQTEMDATSVLFDLNYFKYCFLKATGVDFHELKLETEFQLMAQELTADSGESFLYRDFQARNVMLDAKGNPFFIDFQGGRRGPVEYDVASFLWQASAHYPSVLREELIEVYIRSLKRYTEVNEAAFRSRLNLFVLFRTLQVLGTYGFRGYFERKKYFLDSIPPAIQNLRELLARGGCPYPYLTQVLTKLVECERFAQMQQPECGCAYDTCICGTDISKTHTHDGSTAGSKCDGKGTLTVRIFSFSYRKGIPEDVSGNGGGYVFDCRSTHNPGRYEPYKKLTGLDEPVIRFLEDDGEIQIFLQSVYKLADAHVERYLQRGFTDLMFSFGCTGGQHRSVYSAQHLAEHIHSKYGITVRLCHREQGIEQIFQAVSPSGRD
ncbi:MAG: phosphotransferase [Clostridium sp.]|nr:phosphotransferase [Clostridium sp.]